MSLLGNLANKEVRDFLRTATIKNSYFADRSRLQQVRSGSGYSVPENEIPYYKHMAGEYILKEPTEPVLVSNPKTGIQEEQVYGSTSLVLDRAGAQTIKVENRLLFNESVFDEMMYVTSLDTQETIPFTLENLHEEYASDPSAVHRKTLEAYKLPGRYYDMLCEAYPKQVDLIKAIVYPVKNAREITDEERTNNSENGAIIPSIALRRKDFMISASNFQILNYDENILEEAERFDLTTSMKSLVNLIDYRWNVKEFAVEHNYSTVLWTLLWSALYLGLVVRRFENIKTPFVHSSHVWDYLISKGLASYNGYLSTKWTQFLYKNINYILENRGKQHVTNILLDELLSEAGLDIKTKTVVLNTEKTLDRTHQDVPEDVATQCQSCSRRFVCNKHITSYLCQDFVGIDNQCVAEPRILTEEFTGSRKSKIIAALVSRYGYTEADAETKYNRSMIWRDKDVEEIKAGYDRDQLTDVHKTTDSLDSLIQREHAAGLEPIYDSSVVAQQTKLLQHITGTVAPTKLIEMIKNTPATKYQELFNKFLFQTLFHLAPKIDPEGKVINKVSHLYTIAFNGLGSVFQMSYGELLAMLYLGSIRENRLDLIFDHLNQDEVFEEGKVYFRLKSADDADEFLTVTNANRLVYMEPGVDYQVGVLVGKREYRWMPENMPEEMRDAITASGDKYFKMCTGHDILTNFMQQFSYEFPIPGSMRLDSTWRFGKPVPQEDLVKAWYDPLYLVNEALLLVPAELYEEIDSTPNRDLKALKINGVVYIVSSSTDVDSNSMWAGHARTLKIEGIIKNGIFIQNDGETIIIPEYVRWYSSHLDPDDPADATSKPVPMVIPDGAFSFDTDPYPIEPTIVSGSLYYDYSKNTYYQKVKISQYFDLAGFIDEYVDLSDQVTDQAVIGDYITRMFNLLEKTYLAAEASPDIRTRLAVRAVLDACLMKTRTWKFKLVEDERLSTWPIASNMDFPPSNTASVCMYSEWIRGIPDLQNTINLVDSNQDVEALWSEFNTMCFDAFIDGVKLPYITSIDDNNVQIKLKELVTQLSSYKIAFLDFTGETKTENDLATITSAESKSEIVETERIFVRAIEDSICVPHVGCYSSDDSGNVFVRTQDIVTQDAKLYFKPVQGEPSDTDMISEDAFFYQQVPMEVGTPINPYSLYEQVNLKRILGVDDSGVLQLKHEGNKWYYRTGTLAGKQLIVPATYLDKNAVESQDTYVNPLLLTAEQREKLVRMKLRKTINVASYKWSAWIQDDKLPFYCDPILISDLIADKDKIAVDIVEDVSASADDSGPTQEVPRSGAWYTEGEDAEGESHLYYTADKDPNNFFYKKLNPATGKPFGNIQRVMNTYRRKD